jgi:tight adherence protein B
MPGSDVLIAALLAGGVVGFLVLLVLALRGTIVDPTRPPSRISRWWAQQRSPLLILRVAVAVIVALLVGVVTRWPVAAIGVGAFVAFYPAFVGGSKLELRQIERLDAVVGWTEALRDTTAAHAGLEQAIAATADHTAPAIRPALLRLTGHLRTRVPLDDALLDLAEQLDHAADMIIAALINNVRRRGDGLVQVLTGLAIAGREELDLRRKITASRSEDRRAVALMMPFVVGVAVFLALFADAFVAPYRTPAGQVALAVVLGLFATAFAWIRKLAGGRAPTRFLPKAGEQLQAVDLQIVAILAGGPPSAEAALASGAGDAPVGVHR